MAEQIKAPAYIREIEPYKAGKPISELAREKGLDVHDIVKLASNENPLGAPASAMEAVRKISENIQLAIYPDGNAFDLKHVLSERLDIPAEWIVTGNGSDELMGLVCESLLEPGTNSVFSQFYFSVYEIDTHMVGAEPIIVPAKGFDIDLDAILAAVNENTRVAFLCSPNNPTGLTLTEAQLRSFMERVPSRVTVVIDEAYREFVPPEERPDTVQMARDYPNLFVTRTFSKAYGLAGLRVGFGFSSGELPELINRVRPPFNCNVVAQAAAAGCVNDDAFLEKVYRLVREGVSQFEAAFDRLGLEYVPTKSNFILVKVGPRAEEINAGLLDRGIIIRPCRSFGLPEWIRVSVGTREQNERFIAAFSELIG